MEWYGFFRKNHIAICIDVIKFLSIIWGFEIGYFGGDDNPEFGILNFYFVDGVLDIELLKIHKFSITLKFRLTFLYD